MRVRVWDPWSLSVRSGNTPEMNILLTSVGFSISMVSGYKILGRPLLHNLSNIKEVLTSLTTAPRPVGSLFPRQWIALPPTETSEYPLSSSASSPFFLSSLSTWSTGKKQRWKGNHTVVFDFLQIKLRVVSGLSLTILNCLQNLVFSLWMV